MRRAGSWVVVLGVVGCIADSSPQTWVAPESGMEFVLIQPGAFRMGLESDVVDIRPAPPHDRVIADAFYVGRYEVTQDEWLAVMGSNPSHFTECGGACPVESVTWEDAQTFLERLELGEPGEVFRLPTEAEWEYVCRAGQQAAYTDGRSTLTVENANFNPDVEASGEYAGAPSPVGSYSANAWGVHDIHGNVWEWTGDEYCPYSDAASGPGCGTDTVAIRGGSWHFSAHAALCGRRYTHHKADQGFSLGFRVVREVRTGR